MIFSSLFHLDIFMSFIHLCPLRLTFQSIVISHALLQLQTFIYWLNVNYIMFFFQRTQTQEEVLAHLQVELLSVFVLFSSFTTTNNTSVLHRWHMQWGGFLVWWTASECDAMMDTREEEMLSQVGIHMSSTRQLGGNSLGGHMWNWWDFKFQRWWHPQHSPHRLIVCRRGRFWFWFLHPSDFSSLPVSSPSQTFYSRSFWWWGNPGGNNGDWLQRCWLRLWMWRTRVGFNCCGSASVCVCGGT